MWFINYTSGATGVYCLTAPTQDDLHGGWLKFDVKGNGTGVHALNLADSSLVSYTYRESSTALTSNQITHMAGDLSGGVWFAAYDDPSVSRVKANGEWVQCRTDKMDLPWALGTGKISGIGVDSHNIVYMAPNRRAPLAYDIPMEQWITLPAGPSDDTTFYNLYVDPKDGKWFCGSEFVYHLNADNSAWEIYDTTDTNKFPEYHIQYALMDGEENMWFMSTFILNPAKVSLMKKDPSGGASTWYVFVYGDASGYLGGPRLYLDNDGNVWNSASQRFDSTANTWITQTDTTPFEKRYMRFLNGRIPADMDMTGALSNVTATAQDTMTLDTQGNIYFAGGLGSVNAGIVVRSPVMGDINRNALVELDDAVQNLRIVSGQSSPAQAKTVALDGNGKIGPGEMIFILRKLASGE